MPARAMPPRVIPPDYIVNADTEIAVYSTLQGRFKHYCPDWDYLAIDEKCPEFDGCLCFTPSPKFTTLVLTITISSIFSALALLAWLLWAAPHVS